MSQPTDRQIRFLKDLGIEPAPTRAACARMITYVIQGNGTGGENKFDRAGRARQAQATWHGKRVSMETDAGEVFTGTVLYIRARTPLEVRVLREATDVRAPHAFVACVQWDDKSVRFGPISFTRLKQLVEHHP